MPEISIIIPVYNKEPYIKMALQSVLEQSFRDIEVVVVNDGSTDKSLEIVNRFAETDGRIRIINIPNGGVSNARNVGLSHAKGKWIQFLDADDWLEPDYLTAATQLLQESSADILFSAFNMVDTDGNVVREIPVPTVGKKDQSELCSCFIQSQYKTGFFGYISNKLIRRSMLLKCGAIFPMGVTLAEDLDFYAKLYPEVKEAYFWAGKSFCYRQTSENYLNNSDINYYNQLQIRIDIKTWFEKSGLYQTYRGTLDEKISQYVYYILFYDNENSEGISGAYRFLTSRTDVMESISPSAFKGFRKEILKCLCKKNLLGIKALFAVRNGARACFRAIKRNG